MEDRIKEIADSPAFACVAYGTDDCYWQKGLTIREYYAGQAMAAMIAKANPNILRPQENDKKGSDLIAFSARAVEYADALLSALANED